MKIICGLGNPGSQYERNRHNIGFLVAEAIASRWKCTFSSNKFDAEVASCAWNGHKILLLKPQTYMNLSGTSLGAAARFYKVEPDNVLVVHDELDLPFPKLQLKAGGGTGGHNGLNSIREAWGETSYPRLRFGIGKPAHKEQVVGHVLGDFAPSESSALKEAIEKACTVCESWVQEGLHKAMNRWNGK